MSHWCVCVLLLYMGPSPEEKQTDRFVCVLSFESSGSLEANKREHFEKSIRIGHIPSLKRGYKHLLLGGALTSTQLSAHKVNNTHKVKPFPTEKLKSTPPAANPTMSTEYFKPLGQKSYICILRGNPLFGDNLPLWRASPGIYCVTLPLIEAVSSERALYFTQWQLIL